MCVCMWLECMRRVHNIVETSVDWKASARFWSRGFGFVKRSIPKLGDGHRPPLRTSAACILNMFHTLQRNVAAFRSDVVIADWSHFAIGTDQILAVLDGMRKANVLEGEHVVHLPVMTELLRFQIGADRFTLLMHQGQTKLFLYGNNKKAKS